MAARETRLNIDVTATDRASSVVQEVAAEVEKVEGEHEVDVVASDKASDALAGIRDKLELLTDADKEIVLKGEVRGLEREIGKAERVLRDIGRYDNDTIRVNLEARDNASKKLDAVRTELRALDGETADVRVDVRGGAGQLGDDGAGGVGGLGGALGVGGLVAGLGAAADKAADTAIQVQAIANRTGAPLEQVSRLAAVFADSGVEASDLADMLYNVNGVLRDNPELAEQLGVKITANTTLVDLFLQAVAGVETKFKDVGEAGVVASTLFGEEGVRQIDIVTASVGDLQTAMDDVAGTRVLTADDVQAARDINAELAETKGHIEAIGIALLPIINGLLGGTVSYFDFVAQAGGDARRTLLGGPGTGLVDAVANAGGDFRRTLLAGPGTGLFTDDPAQGRFDPATLAAILDGRPTQTHPTITIYNPPGTPAATADQSRQYLQRNGYR